MTTDADDLWDFSVGLYGRTGISAICLDLQERFDADVPVLLYALWLAGRGVKLTSSSLVQINANVGEWRASIVGPLRHIRRILKTGPNSASASVLAPSAETEVLRSKVKEAELMAEKIELDHLASLAWPDAPVSATEGLFHDNLTTALKHYAGAHPLDEDLCRELAASAFKMKQG